MPNPMVNCYKTRNDQKGSKMAAESKMAAKKNMAAKKTKPQMMHVLRGFEVKKSDENVI